MYTDGEGGSGRHVPLDYLLGGLWPHKSLE